MGTMANTRPVLPPKKAVLLRLLSELNHPVTNAEFQVLLFLFTKRYRKHALPSLNYDFVPHRLGAYSFTCAADKFYLMKRRMLKRDEKHWELSRHGLATAQVCPPLMGLKDFVRRHGRLGLPRLLSDQYCLYPFYATRSTILERVLPDLNYRKYVIRARAPQRAGGLIVRSNKNSSLETTINKLLENSVTLLCDLRPATVPTPSLLEIAWQSMGLRCERFSELNHAPEIAGDLDLFERKTMDRRNRLLAPLAKFMSAGFRPALICGCVDEKSCRSQRVARVLTIRTGDAWGTLLV
jgi:hypothetical protein